MDVSGGQSVYPLHRCKTIHLVRHAQGIHNVEGEKDHSAYLSRHLFDAHLTPLGWQQVDNLRKHVQTSGISKRVELVITSPLLRCMQTAVGVFGGEDSTDGTDVPPLMVTDAGESNHPAISSLNCPPFIAVEGCREHLVEELGMQNDLFMLFFGGNLFHLRKRSALMGMDKKAKAQYYWDEGREFTGVIREEALANTSLYFLQLTFPWQSSLIEQGSPLFSQIESDDDVLWELDVREKIEDVASRGIEFFKWLWTRKEKEIAIVTHSGLLTHTLAKFGRDCHPDVKSEISKRFQNCELRTMVLVDRSMVGSDSSATNYPGKIPSGEDAPSDLACTTPDGLPN
uniref:Phosphoglycerate mutase-like protein 1 n=1 Tax=Solanum lycopersicum TaxID=4081 RepID=A0A3Q7G5N2_SOLLC